MTATSNTHLPTITVTRLERAQARVRTGGDAAWADCHIEGIGTLRGWRLWYWRNGEIRVSEPPFVRLDNDELMLSVKNAILSAYHDSLSAVDVLMAGTP